MRELRMAVRQLTKSRGFTVVAVLSLAIGIGANTAIFSLVNDFLLRSLPVRSPDELVLLRNIDGAGGRMSRSGENNGSIDPVTGRAASTSFSLLSFERMRSQRSALSSLFAFAPFSRVNILVDGQPEITGTAQMVSGGYHGDLGVSATLGRTISPEDDRTSAPPVAVISYRYWERRFERRPDVLGKIIAINRVPTTIVGVTAKGFDGAMQAGESPDVSVPLAHYLLFQPDRTGRAQPSYWWIRVMGRLAPGATPAQAAASLEPAFQQAASEGWVAGRPAGTPSDERMPNPPTLVADPGARGENDTRRQFSASLRTLMGLVSLLLAAACANVANLLLARGAARRREIALRLALGASRGRIVRQLLAESLLLAVAGAALGMAFAWWGRDLLLALRPFGNTTVVLDLPLDGRVLAFTTAVTFGTALLFGLSPALRATSVNLNSEFQSGGRTSWQRSAFASQPRTHGRPDCALPGAPRQHRSLRAHVEQPAARRCRIQPSRPGALPHRRVVCRLLPQSVHDAAGAPAREHRKAARGARGHVLGPALLSRVRQNKRISVPGHTPPSAPLPIVNTNGLASNFFRAMELPLVLGRDFTEQDNGTAPKVAVVNQAFVRMYFDDENPVGKPIVIPGYAERVEVIGVAGDAKYTELRGAAPPTVYLPSLQQVDGDASFAVRLGGASRTEAAFFSAIRSAVREVDPALPVLNLRTQDEQINRLNGQELLFAKLSGLFGVLALLGPQVQHWSRIHLAHRRPNSGEERSFGPARSADRTAKLHRRPPC